MKKGIQINSEVCIICKTYNHKPFIEDAMNGFCIQKTRFPYVAIIIDDCSTDGEPKIIYDYFYKNFDLLEEEESGNYVLILGHHKTNRNCYFAVFFLKYNHYLAQESTEQYYSKFSKNTKYTALCEGDDYWIDDGKIQMQYDTLQNNKRATFVYTNFQTVDVKSSPIYIQHYQDLVAISHTGYIFLDLLANYNYILTVTTFFRSEFYSGLLQNYFDYGLFLRASRAGMAIFIPQITANYRINPNSLTHTNNDSLHPKRAFIHYNEVRECMDGNICKEIKNHYLYKKTMGLIIGTILQRRYSPYRWRFLILLLKHPSYIFPTMLWGVVALFKMRIQVRLKNAVRDI